HLLGKRYEGDAVAVKVERDKKEVEFARVVLGSAEAAYPDPFLGILPLRDDPEPGVAVRYVYPKSPAEKAGLKEGDRIMKIAPPNAPAGTPLFPITRGRDQLLTAMRAFRPGQELKVEVKRKDGGKVETLTAKLAEVPADVPAKLPETASAGKALTRPGVKPPDKPAPAKKEKEETGTMKKTSPAADHTYWLYVPTNYDANIAHSVVVWFHPLGKGKQQDLEDFISSWETFCDDHHIILVCPQSENPRGWTPGEADFVMEAVKTVMSTYTVDMQRVVAHGMGVGGEMALYVAFQARAVIRAVAVVGASLSSNPREREGDSPLAVFLVVGGKDPIQPAVVQTRDRLAQLKYAVILREIAPLGHEYIDGKAGVPTLEELIRWIDSLDRL
ncbi:MAG: PDZ domain-containing protein, partial [Gemmataceae bacterium]